MPGENTIRKRFLPGMLMLLLMVFALSGCGRMTDTSGLSGRWVLVRGDSDGVLLPESLIKDNRLTLRLDPDGSGLLGENTSQGRVLWNYEDGKILLQAGDTTLSGTVEGNELLLQGEGETRLHFVRDTQEEAAEEKTAFPAEAFSGGWYGRTLPAPGRFLKRKDRRNEDLVRKRLCEGGIENAQTGQAPSRKAGRPGGGSRSK